MSSPISKHGKERIIQRNEEISSFAEAKKLAKQAKKSGKTINCFHSYPRFFSYLQNKKHQTNECLIRIYRGCIYIWRGKSRTLVTAHPIPQRYIDEMKEIDGGGEECDFGIKS